MQKHRTNIREARACLWKAMWHFSFKFPLLQLNLSRKGFSCFLIMFAAFRPLFRKSRVQILLEMSAFLNSVGAFTQPYSGGGHWTWKILFLRTVSGKKKKNDNTHSARGRAFRCFSVSKQQRAERCKSNQVHVSMSDYTGSRFVDPGCAHRRDFKRGERGKLRRSERFNKMYTIKKK